MKSSFTVQAKMTLCLQSNQTDSSKEALWLGMLIGYHLEAWDRRIINQKLVWASRESRTTSQLWFFSLSSPLSPPPHLPFPTPVPTPHQLLLGFPLEKIRPPRDINQTQHIKLQKHQAPLHQRWMRPSRRRNRVPKAGKVVQDSSASNQGSHKNTNLINYNFPFCGDEISEQTTVKEEKICFMVSEVSIQLCPTS